MPWYERWRAARKAFEKYRAINIFTKSDAEALVSAAIELTEASRAARLNDMKKPPNATSTS